MTNFFHFGLYFIIWQVIVIGIAAYFYCGWHWACVFNFMRVKKISWFKIISEILFWPVLVAWLFWRTK